MGKVSCKKSKFRGWRAVTLDNDLVTLVVVPDIGGRIMAFNLGSYEYLYVDPELAGKLFSPEENYGQGRLVDWKNYGGDKTWPAPQGWEDDSQWHGPPDPVLDTGRYSLAELECEDSFASLKMISPPDYRTGVQITRQVGIIQGSSRVRLDLAFTNITDRQIRWSIWDVVQLNAAKLGNHSEQGHDSSCVVTAPLDPNSRFPRGFNVMFGEENNPQWTGDQQSGLFKASYQWKIGKVGIDSPGGWIAFSNNSQGYGFVEQFDYELGGEYPDDGATVECWTVGDGVVESLDYSENQIYLMETEVLSTMRDIHPGKSTYFTIEWGACRCPGTIVEVSDGGCFSKSLSAARQEEMVKVEAELGVFDVGALNLWWINENGERITTEQICRVSPQNEVVLENIFTPPEAAVGVEIGVIRDSDSGIRMAANAWIE
jgi:hypothetical protein